MQVPGELEAAAGRKAQQNFLPMQAGDVRVTCADTRDLQAATGFAPSTPLAEGVKKFVSWFRDYYEIQEH